MEKKLKIREFIRENPDWERLLTEKPYSLIIQHDEVFGRRLVLLKYNQVESDMSLELVKECRGIILDEDTFEPVCVPFFKFFNAGEPNAAEIDWKTAWTSTKLDGSLSKVVKLGDNLLVSTNGTIDAYKAPVQEQIGFVGKTFGGLFEMALLNAQKKAMSGRACCDWYLTPIQWLAPMLEEGYTYMFELTSPYNKVVVSWPEPKLWFIGCRDNKTLKEIRYSDHPLSKVFDTPETFPLTNLNEVKAAAEKLDCNHEGFVVCDGNFDRLKVKSELYVRLHHMCNNHVLSFERGIELVRENELDEVLTYFPEFKEHLEKIRDDIAGLVERLNAAWLKFKCVRHMFSTRKELAMVITNGDCFGKLSGIGFALLDGKISSVEEWVKNVSAKKLVQILGYKEKSESQNDT